MKKGILLIILNLLFCLSYSQILLEDKSGDIILRNQFRDDNNCGLIKLNTGDESIGFNYITSNKLSNTNKYRISEFGVKAKPTDGYAVVISNGQFSPGVKFSYALTQVRIFSKRITDSYIDWGGIEVNYDLNQYTLFSRDSAFKNQVYSQDFKGFSAYLNYSILLNSRFIINLKAGYSRKNNYDDLSSVEVKDVTTYTDPLTATIRQVTKTKKARQGNYVEYDGYPLLASYTKATPTDAPGSPGASKLRIGYTIYARSLTSRDLPKTDAGVILFFTRQDKNGIRTPVFGLDINANDPFDVQKQNNGLINRLSVGFTSIFTL